MDKALSKETASSKKSEATKASDSAKQTVTAPESSPKTTSPEEKIQEFFAASQIDWSSILSTLNASHEAGRAIVSKSKYMDATIKAHSKNKVIINGIFDQIYDLTTDANQLRRMIVARFDFKLATGDLEEVDRTVARELLDYREQKFGINGLQHVYSVMLKLPAEHVKRLVSLTTDNTTEECPSGVTLDSKYINIAYSENNTDTKETGDYTDEGDAMQGMTIFDTTLAHEMGHVGDKNDKYSRDPEFLKIAGWKEYQSGSEVVKAMMSFITQPLPATLDTNDIKAAKSAAETIIDDEKTDIDTYGRIIRNQYKNNTSQKTSAKKGNSTKTAQTSDSPSNEKINQIKQSNLITHINRAFADNSPWMDECFDELPQYQIHQGYSGWSWWSYKNSARTDIKKNSRYQFRDPGEDFAELYATYFMGDEATKQQIEPQRKSWFEKTIVNAGNQKKSNKKTTKKSTKKSNKTSI